jgi:hypothetical protein
MAIAAAFAAVEGKSPTRGPREDDTCIPDKYGRPSDRVQPGLSEGTDEVRC